MAQFADKKTDLKIKNLLPCILLGVGILIDIIMMSSSVAATDESVWRSAALWISASDYTNAICMAFILLFAINTVVSAAGIVSMIVKQGIRIYPFGVGLISHVIMLAMSIAFGIFEGFGVFLLILHLLLTAIGASLCIVSLIVSGKKEYGATNLFGNRKSGIGFALAAVSTLCSLSLFYIPFYSYTVEEEVNSLIPLGVLNTSASKLVCAAVFSALLVLCAFSIACLLKSLESYSTSEARFAAKIRNAITLNVWITGGYFVGGVAYCVFANSRGGLYTTSSYLPFLITTAIAVIYAFLARGIDQGGAEVQADKAKAAKLEFFAYGLLVTVFTAISALTDILRVKITEPADIELIKLNGFKILTAGGNISAGFQLLAFLLIAILTVMLSLFVASLVSMISRSKLFYKITLAEILCGAVSSLLIGLFGKYYEIVQKMNEEVILTWIRSILGIDGIKIVYKVTGQSFWWFLAVVAVIVVVLIRKPYTRGTLNDIVIAADAPIESEQRKEQQAESAPTEALSKTMPDSDPCPAFTELDRNADRILSEQVLAGSFAFEAPTLPALVQFVVNYARDSRLHLSYTPEDIAAFVAGLGATRLTILQGMSGTGKTSLPKIFTEAIMGNCEIVEVESSWRDKNELLGYYNEFSRTYTPKKFTQALYKAKLNPDRLTFIVLDEMNLSRIEYYFSDFLSLMENEEDKREIKLLSVGLYRTRDGRRFAYRGLSKGHTIKIPNNVWFIGTANRDESTFEISDKVYDRAHTMNFNKRAPKVLYPHDPIAQRYLSVGELVRLMNEAKQSVNFNLDNCAVVKEVEQLLEPYHISFGNRVANQIEDFVRIYCACFAPSDAIMNDALETILLSKVVSKLEFRSIENKEYLAAELRRLNLHKCSEFVMKLNED